MNSKMKILLTLILVATLALGVVNSVSAEDLNVNGEITIDSISYNANSNEIKNVVNEINMNDRYSDNGISDGNLIQENGASSNGKAISPVLNSEKECNLDMQFINGTINCSSISLINSVNMVNSSINDGSINSIENMMLIQTQPNNTIDNGEVCLTENSIMTHIKGNEYAITGIDNSEDETNMNNHVNNLKVNVISIDEHEFVNSINVTKSNSINNNVAYSSDITNNKNRTEKRSINMDLAVGTYDVTAINLKGDEYSSSNNTVQIAEQPKEVNMTIECENITYGETENITISLTDNINGNVSITLSNGYSDQVTIINGVGTLQITNLNAGNYTMDALYNSTNSNYSSVNKTVSFIVSPANTTIILYLKNMTYSENLTGQIGLLRNDVPVTGTTIITLTIDDIDRNYQIKVINGIGIINLRPYYQDPALSDAEIPGEYHYLPVGKHTANVVVAGDENYAVSYANETFNVIKATPKLNITVEGEYVIIVNLPIGIIEPITVYVNGERYLVNVTKGIAKLHLDSLTPGTYYVEAVFDGNKNYWNATANTTFIVPNNDYDGHENVTKGNLLLESTSIECGNPIALLILALAIVLPIRRVFK